MKYSSSPDKILKQIKALEKCIGLLDSCRDGLLESEFGKDGESWEVEEVIDTLKELD